MVQSHGGRYALAPDVKPEQPLFTRALDYFVNWTEQHRKDHALIGDSGGAILLLLKQAVDAQAWNEVRRLGHASEEALTVSGKWDMWANVLDSIELAAKAQGDVAERAWVLLGFSSARAPSHSEIVTRPKPICATLSDSESGSTISVAPKSRVTISTSCLVHYHRNVTTTPTAVALTLDNGLRHCGQRSVSSS